MCHIESRIETLIKSFKLSFKLDRVNAILGVLYQIYLFASNLLLSKSYFMDLDNSVFSHIFSNLSVGSILKFEPSFLGKLELLFAVTVYKIKS